MILRRVCVLVSVVWAVAAAGFSAEIVHHDLEVRIDPAEQAVAVVDDLSLNGAVVADENGAYHFVLHAGMAPRVTTPGWRLEPVAGPVEADFFGINATTETVSENVPLEGFRLFREEGAEEPVEIVYRGRIDHELATQGEEYQRSFSETPGLIDE